jgi:hypothetical protein
MKPLKSSASGVFVFVEAFFKQYEETKKLGQNGALQQDLGIKWAY